MLRELIIVGALLSAGAGEASGQTPGAVFASAEAPSVGSAVRDARGRVLGRVARVIFDEAGRPAQVVIRGGGIAGARAQSRAVPVASLRRARGGYVLPLSRQEFDALPTVQR